MWIELNDYNGIYVMISIIWFLLLLLLSLLLSILLHIHATTQT